MFKQSNIDIELLYDSGQLGASLFWPKKTPSGGIEIIKKTNDGYDFTVCFPHTINNNQYLRMGFFFGHGFGRKHLTDRSHINLI